VAGRAAAFAGRLLRQDIGRAERIAIAFREAYGRKPTGTEANRAAQFLTAYEQEAVRAE
jgi:hypothetical protein